MDWQWKASIIFLTIGFGLHQCAHEARSHDQMTGLPNWITKSHSSCCGENDCHRMSPSDVEVRSDGIFIKGSGELIPYNNPLIRQSQDGEWWRCVYLNDSENWERNTTRCLFVPGVS